MMALTETDAKNLLAFLARVDLKGAEAPTLMALCQKIGAIKNPPEPPIPSPAEANALDTE